MRLDFADVRGNDLAIAALTHAAARRTGVVLTGAPGIGKTMIARRAPGLLGPLSDLDSTWITAEYTALGLTECGVLTERPFRAPHHTVSAAAMAGAYARKHRIECPQVRAIDIRRPIKCTCERSNSAGGMERVFRPGECHLARFGVLLLDDLIEFARSTVEVIAETIRGMAPRTRPWIIATASACPCGWHGSDRRECVCTPGMVDRWRDRLSQSLRTLEIGENIPVHPMDLASLRTGDPGTSTAELRRIVGAIESMAASTSGAV